MNNVNPYQIQGDIGSYKVVDIRTGREAHTFKHHPDAESCRDSMNEWVRQEAVKAAKHAISK
jgi:hypothetical protein